MNLHFSDLFLDSFGVYLPEKTVSSLELEQRLEPLYERFRLSPGRLELMSGIESRRIWPPNTLPSQVAAEAGQRALDNSGIDSAKIGCLINTSVCRDCLEPATANIIHHQLNLPDDCLVMDISNACLGFLNGIVTAGLLIETGAIEAALITAGENGEPLLESTIRHALESPDLDRQTFKKMFASLTIGSGAVAAVISNSHNSRSRHRIIGGTVYSQTSHCNLCVGGTSNQSSVLMETSAEQLLDAGINLATKTWKEFSQAFNISAENLDHVFCHQVGRIHRRQLYNALEIPLKLDYSTMEFLGNIGSVSLPVTFALGLKPRQVKPADQIALLGIGSGINCMMLSVQW